MNGTHVLAFVLGAGFVLAAQLFAALIIRKKPDLTDMGQCGECGKLKRIKVVEEGVGQWCEDCFDADITGHFDDDDAPPGSVSMERLCAQRFQIIIRGETCRDMSLYGLLLACEMNPAAGTIKICEGGAVVIPNEPWRAPQ